MPSITGLDTTSVLTVVENRIPCKVLWLLKPNWMLNRVTK